METSIDSTKETRRRENSHTNRTQKLDFLSSVSFQSFVESASC